MIRRTPRTTRTEPRFPYPTRFRSAGCRGLRRHRGSGWWRWGLRLDDACRWRRVVGRGRRVVQAGIAAVGLRQGFEHLPGRALAAGVGAIEVVLEIGRARWRARVVPYV